MRSFHYYIRRTHRYLGIFIGIQFLLWTLGGLYFSWTNIDEIHGDHLVNRRIETPKFPFKLLSPDSLIVKYNISKDSLESVRLSPSHDGWYYSLKFKNKIPEVQYNAQNGRLRPYMNRSEALHLAGLYFRNPVIPDTVVYVTRQNISSFLDYRGGSLPAWGIHYNQPEKVWLYLSVDKHRLEKVRTDKWKVFDFLWMLHIMDFNERDNINNTILRIFSILGLLTITSGFILFWVSSRTVRKWKNTLF